MFRLQIRICKTTKKPIKPIYNFNYSTNNASTKTFPTISVLANIPNNSSYNTLSLTLNPFKSYSGSITGFGAPIRNKF